MVELAYQKPTALQFQPAMDMGIQSMKIHVRLMAEDFLAMKMGIQPILMPSQVIVHEF